MNLDFNKTVIEKVASPPLVLFYGGPGIGKTALGIGSDETNNYDVGKENHLLVNVDFRGGDRLACRRAFNDETGPMTEDNVTDMLMEVFKTLAETDHNIRWICIDDLSTLEELFVAEVCKENKVDEIRKIEYGKGFELAKTKWLRLFTMISELQEIKNIGVILLGHTKIEKQKDPMTEAYSHHDLQLDQRSKDVIKKKVELVGFCHKKTFTKEKDAGFGKKDILPVGESKRVITFAPDMESFESKDRFKLPSEIDLNWRIFEEELNKSFEMPSEKVVKKSKKGEK